MTCNELEYTDVAVLKIPHVEINDLLREAEIEFCGENDAWYFKSVYARDRAKAIILKKLIVEYETTIPGSMFKE